MNFFTCPLCSNQREFRTFSTFFRHVTLFHQHDSKFTIICNLSQTCGTLYRTFAAYKSHVYRKHQAELHAVYQQPSNISSPVDCHGQDEINGTSESDSMEESFDDDASLAEDDSIDFQGESSFNSYLMDELMGKNNLQEENEITMKTIVKSFILFLLQLRENLFLPKSTMNIITNYVITLIENLHVLLRRKAVSCSFDDSSSSLTASKLSGEMISLKLIEEIINDVCRQLQGVTKNEYRFIQKCHELLDYNPPEEIIIINGNSKEESENGYFIPIERTISRMLTNDLILSGTMHHIQQEKRSTILDDDLMFSFRDGHFGTRIDDDSLLIQLYLDDIGVTNPIGAKKDSNKLAMMYFSLEDIPEEYRSKLDYIQLLAICNSQVLKVKPHRPLFPNTSKAFY